MEKKWSKIGKNNVYISNLSFSTESFNKRNWRENEEKTDGKRKTV